MIRVSAPHVSRDESLWDEHCFCGRLTTVIFERRYAAGIPLVISLTDKPIDCSSCRRPVEGSARRTECLKVVGFLVRAC